MSRSLAIKRRILLSKELSQYINSNNKIPFSDLFSLARENLNNDFDKYFQETAKSKGTLFFNNIFRQTNKP